jgi:hypothetical protein
MLQDVVVPESVEPHGAPARIAAQCRVFVSYAGPDRPWAEWAGAVLEATGRFAVELDVWDWSIGDNAILRISQAVQRADVVVALWSPAYFEPDRFTLDEWASVAAVPGCVRP